MKLDFLFAYGTLLAGGPPHVMAAVAAHARVVGPAVAPGRLYDSGEWPALLPPVDSADRVPGTLLEVRRPRRLWPVLDAWEGCGPGIPEPHLFRRERAEVSLPGGGRTEAWLYRFAGDASGWPRIQRWPPEGPVP